MSDVYFGRRWDAPAFDEATEIPPPVGRDCLYCEEPIDAADSGTLMPYAHADGTGSVEPVHIECFVRTMLGDVPHLEGRCLCYGHHEHDTRPYRDGARAALQWLIDHHQGRFV